MRLCFVCSDDVRACFSDARVHMRESGVDASSLEPQAVEELQKSHMRPEVEGAFLLYFAHRTWKQRHRKGMRFFERWPDLNSSSQGAQCEDHERSLVFSY